MDSNVKDGFSDSIRANWILIDIGSKEKRPRCRFLYDHLQSLEVVILRFRKISSKQAVQNAIFCRIK